MSMIRLKSNVNIETISMNKDYNPQMKKHLIYMLKKFEYNWFDKSEYKKELGWQNKDIEIFGQPTKGNMVDNFSWYMTKFKKMSDSPIEEMTSEKQKSEVEQLKDYILELEAELKFRSDLQNDIV